MHLQIDPQEHAAVIRAIVAEILTAIDWPVGRLALTEPEAAAACGVGRHVLRDLRLAGKIKARKLGKRVVYTRADVLVALQAATDGGGDEDSLNNPSNCRRRSRRC